MHQNTTISAIIITKNESHNIRDCLESVKWADEIIVFDSGSIDETVEIAREYTDKVFETDWPGFGPQKNRALEKATSDWVLSIDADERITPELKKEILEVRNNNQFDAFDMPRLSRFCGKPIMHSGWWPDRVVRLFRKEKGKFTDSLVHERLIVQGKIGQLRSHLSHFSFENIDELIEKMNCYSSYGSLQKYRESQKGGLLKAVIRGLWMFLKTYFFKLGILDGKEGFIIAVSSAESTYYRYLKLMYLYTEKKH